MVSKGSLIIGPQSIIRFMSQYVFLESLYARRAHTEGKTKSKEPMSKCFKSFGRIIIGVWEGSRKGRVTEHEQRHCPSKWS